MIALVSTQGAIALSIYLQIAEHSPVHQYMYHSLGTGPKPHNHKLLMRPDKSKIELSQC